MILTKTVTNPHFVEDTIELLELHTDQDTLEDHLAAIEKQRPTHYEKLVTLIDRIEFINHLNVVVEHIEQSEFNIDGSEVIGIDHDIAALRLYLALTCVDIFSVFVPFNRWLLDHCDDQQDGETLEGFLGRKSKEYEDSVSTGVSFIASFAQAPPEIVNQLERNLIVVANDGSGRNDIQSIGRYFYRIRNRYTHEGRRFHNITDSPTPMFQSIGPRDEEGLVILPNFDLVVAILSVAKTKAYTELALQAVAKSTP